MFVLDAWSRLLLDDPLEKGPDVADDKVITLQEVRDRLRGLLNERPEGLLHHPVDTLDVRQQDLAGRMHRSHVFRFVRQGIEGAVGVFLYEPTEGVVGAVEIRIALSDIPHHIAGMAVYSTLMQDLVPFATRVRDELGGRLVSFPNLPPEPTPFTVPKDPALG